VFRATVEESEKRQIRNAFRRYLNPEVTDMLARDPSRLRLGGERREITVLFSDIRGFTGISERLDAPVLADLLNQYLGAMTDIVFKHAGLLDKYVGDAVMAFWGAPVDAPDHAARCCRAALDMLAELQLLQVRWQRVGLPPIVIRVGLNSGQAAVGNFGSPQRFSYTAVGDSVNLASRLEGLNTVYGTHILVSEATRSATGTEFVCREIDRVRVAGRRQPVQIHELLGRRVEDHDGALSQRAAAYEAALRAYRRQAWDDAIAQLEALLRIVPGDMAAVALRTRCQAFRTAPPPSDWEAVFDATTK
jgi:adenylate cyclase